ncbi:MAG: HNH endonuclease [Verrucomicrobiaceae bacterium]|nr:HNH endonuclease [Verrucomicrobiaceae bacterium]
MPDGISELPFQIDHVVAEKHGGNDDPANLAWACYRCNTHKGPNLAGMAGQPPKLCRLFNPRTDQWDEHFRWSGPTLLGKTPIGKATISVLCINRVDSTLLRRSLIAEGIPF